MMMSYYIQHDFSQALNGMVAPTGLTSINNPCALTYLPEECVDPDFYGFYWQKSVRKYPFKADDLYPIIRRINAKLTQFREIKMSTVYSQDEFKRAYPALSVGFWVADLRNDVDGIVIIIRINN